MSLKTERKNLGMLVAEAGATSLKGGDGGHGSKGILKIENPSELSISLKITDEFKRTIEIDLARLIEINFNGDWELLQMKEALEFMLEKLNKDIVTSNIKKPKNKRKTKKKKSIKFDKFESFSLEEKKERYSRFQKMFFYIASRISRYGTIYLKDLPTIFKDDIEPILEELELVKDGNISDKAIQKGIAEEKENIAKEEKFRVFYFADIVHILNNYGARLFYHRDLYYAFEDWGYFVKVGDKLFHPNKKTYTIIDIDKKFLKVKLNPKDKNELPKLIENDLLLPNEEYGNNLMLLEEWI